MNTGSLSIALLAGIFSLQLVQTVNSISGFDDIDARVENGAAESAISALPPDQSLTADDIWSIVVERDPSLASAVVAPSEVNGLWTLTIDGKSAYVSADGQHILKGPAKLIGNSDSPHREPDNTVDIAALPPAEKPSSNDLGIDPSTLIKADVWPDTGIVPLNFSGDDQRVSLPLISHIEDVVASYAPLVKMGYTDIDSITLSYIANTIPEDRLAAVYKPEHPSGASITVFADPTCPKCQQFHAEIPELTAAGFEVRYVLLPRNADDKQLSSAIGSVYCQSGMQAKQSVIEKLYSGEDLGEYSCESNELLSINSATDFYSVKSTPTIYVKNTGVVFPGYVPSSVLIQMEKYRKEKEGLES